MKKSYLILLLYAAMPFIGWSQQVISPNKNLVNKKFIHNQHYQMEWTMLKDTSRFTVGLVDTKVGVTGDKIQVITTVKMKSSPSSWIDSTIVKTADFSPVYHASYNAQREMAIEFGTEIKGFYHDKTSGKKTAIAQQVEPGYFDSNFYPMLINWLPLKTGFKADLNIFDYNPNGKTGVIKAHILNVSEGKYRTKNSGDRKVWIVEASDEISSAGGKSIYQIDQITRQLYLQRITMGNRIMEMKLVEP